MTLSTTGFNYYPNYVMPISVSDNVSSLDSADASSYYKLVLLNQGVNHFILNEQEYLLSGPLILILNAKDHLSIRHHADSEVLLLFFHPNVVNSEFTLDIIDHLENAHYPITIEQDLFYLYPFKSLHTNKIKLHTLTQSNYLSVLDKFSTISELTTLQNTSYWPCQTRANLIELLFLLSDVNVPRHDEEPFHVASNCSKLVLDLLYYLQSHYTEKITLHTLSQTFHTNRTSLINEFKKYTNLSLNRYLMQLRIQVASSLLRDTELPIAEICERTGFSDVSYFSKAFKKEVCLSPSEYRTKYCIDKI